MQDFNKLTAYELKTLCKQCVPRVSPSGLKCDIVLRLVDHHVTKRRENRAVALLTFNPTTDPTGETRILQAIAEYDEDVEAENIKSSAIKESLEDRIKHEDARHENILVAAKEDLNKSLARIKAAVKEDEMCENARKRLAEEPQRKMEKVKKRKSAVDAASTVKGGDALFGERETVSTEGMKGKNIAAGAGAAGAKNLAGYNVGVGNDGAQKTAWKEGMAGKDAASGGMSETRGNAVAGHDTAQKPTDQGIREQPVSTKGAAASASVDKPEQIAPRSQIQNEPIDPKDFKGVYIAVGKDGVATSDAGLKELKKNLKAFHPDVILADEAKYYLFFPDNGAGRSDAAKCHDYLAMIPRSLRWLKGLLPEDVKEPTLCDQDDE